MPQAVYAEQVRCNFFQKLLNICPVVQVDSIPTSPPKSAVAAKPAIKSGNSRIRVVRKKTENIPTIDAIEGANEKDDLFSQLTNLEYDKAAFNPVENVKTQQKPKKRIKVVPRIMATQRVTTQQKPKKRIKVIRPNTSAPSDTKAAQPKSANQNR